MAPRDGAAGGFRWEMLVDDPAIPTRASERGTARWSILAANVNPSDRYVLSLARDAPRTGSRRSTPRSTT